jgi:predicted ATP-grasp superfamily ATP-dependent carboligase
MTLIEINPRPTASYELTWFRRCREYWPFRHPEVRVWGKAIYHAPVDFTVPEEDDWLAGLDVADVPLPGTFHRKGMPLITLRMVQPLASRDPSQGSILDRLRGQAAWLDQQIGPSASNAMVIS